MSTATIDRDITMTVSVRAHTRDGIARALQEILDQVTAGSHGHLVTEEYAGSPDQSSYAWRLTGAAGR